MWLTVLIHAAKLIKSDNMSKQLSSFNSYYSLIWGNQSQFQTLIVKKWHKNLHVSFFCSTFAAAKYKTRRNMKQQEPKQMPLGRDNTTVGMPQKEYFTADEAMAFLEPRIRAMFR
jgi:hypothetical protein